jgi:glycosyltransferase involved in cell wall biosynthesis
MQAPVGKETTPEVSVVLCVRNGAATLDQQLAALAAQDFDGAWEVVLVDNGSTDATRAIASAWKEKIPWLRLVSENAAGLNRARNTGIHAARAPRIVLCDADDEVTASWVQAMVAGLRQFDVVGGALEPFPNRASRWQKEDCPQQTALPNKLERPFAVGANLGLLRRVFDTVGGFDETFSFGADEVDFCLRAQHADCSIGFVPDAIVRYRTKETAGSVMRQWFRYGRGHQRLVEKHAERGWIRSPLRERWQTVAFELGSTIRHLPDGLRRTSRLAYLARGAHVVGEVAELVKPRRARGPHGPPGTAA